MNIEDGSPRHLASSIEVRLLGSVRATTAGGCAINLGGPMPKVVLVRLALRAGEVVSTNSLVDTLWGEDPPPTARRSLQAHVAKLRAALGADDGPLRSSGRGYVLDLPRSRVDVLRIEDLIQSARAQMSINPIRAAELIAGCRDDWTGAPLTDLEDQETLSAERERLQRLKGELDEIEADLQVALGNPAASLPQLERAVVADPTHEPNWVRLITAYYATGRQRDALNAYGRASATLLDRLGVDPSPQLKQLELQILRQEMPVTDGRFSCPYKGLVSYQIADGADFYGRSDTTDELVNLVLRAPVGFVVGPSGVGKSSVLRAGLAHRVLSGQIPELLTVSVMTPGPQPLRSLYAAGQADLLIVDQFEELFTLTDDLSRRQEFLDEMLASARMNRTRVLISVRADFYGHCLSLAGVSKILGRYQVNLSAMSKVGLSEAIEGPATQAGLVVEQALLDTLIAEVADRSGALPLLSHALSETWRRRSGSTLTLGAYRQSGSISGAISATAERLYGGLVAGQRQQLERLFQHLVEPGTGSAHTRRVVSRAEIDEAGFYADLIDRLVAARLLTTTTDQVEIAHEALITAWPRLTEWMDSERDNIVAHQRLARAASAWMASGKDDADLYRGNKLRAALTWRSEVAPRLSMQESEFLDYSEASEEDEANRQRRTNRRLKVLAGVSVVTLVAALSATVIAVGRSRDADRRREQAEVNQLVAAIASDESLTRVDLLRTAAALHARSSTPDSMGFLLDSIVQSPGLVSTSDLELFAIPAEGPLTSSGMALLALDLQGRLIVVNGVTLEIERIPTNVSPVVVTRVGDRTIGVVRDFDRNSGEASYAVVDVATQRVLGPPTVVGEEASSVALSQNGLLLGLGYDAGVATAARIDVIEVSSGSIVSRLGIETSTLSELEFAANGSLLSVVVDGSSLELWEVGDRSRVLRTNDPGLSQAVTATAFNAQGNAVAVGRRDGTVEIWRAAATDGKGEGDVRGDDTGNGEIWRSVRAGRLHSSAATWVEFDTDDARVVSSAIDGSAVVWDAQSGSPLTDPVRFSSSGALVSFFDPESLEVITIDSTGSTWRWSESTRGGLVSAIPATSGRRPSHDAMGWIGVADGAAVVMAADEVIPLGTDQIVLDAVNGPSGDVVLVGEDRLEWRRDEAPVLSFPVAGREVAGRFAVASNVLAFVDPARNRIIVIDESGATVDRIGIDPSRKVATLDVNRLGTDLVYSTTTGELIWYSLDILDAAVLLKAGHGYDGHFTADGRIVAVGVDGVQLIDLDEPNSPIAQGFGRGAVGIAYEQGGPIAATLDADGVLRLWDLASGGQRVGRDFVPLPTGQPRWIGFDGAGRLIIGGTMKSVVLQVEPDVWRLQACGLAAVLDPGGELPPNPRLAGLESCP